jgi:quercetin dioxygenase-like cupin family protein
VGTEARAVHCFNFVMTETTSTQATTTSGLDHLEPYLLAPSSLTPTALQERADLISAEIAAAGGAAALLAGNDGQPVALRGNFLYDAWLVSWAPGDATDLHAHRIGFQAVTVLEGTLRETIATSDGLDEAELTAGGRLTTRPGHTHRLVAGQTGAVSLVLSSPPRPVPVVKA